MPDRTYLAWPFFEARHRALAEEIERWQRSVGLVNRLLQNEAE